MATPQPRKGFTNPDFFGDAIISALHEYSDTIAAGTLAAVDTVTKEVNAEIKKHITFVPRTGKYVKSFRTKTTFSDKRNKRNTWYVANGEHRKTHLLENGHVNRNGTRTRAFPHIKYGEELAVNRLPELIEGVIRNG